MLASIQALLRWIDQWYHDLDSGQRLSEDMRDAIAEEIRATNESSPEASDRVILCCPIVGCVLAFSYGLECMRILRVEAA